MSARNLRTGENLFFALGGMFGILAIVLTMRGHQFIAIAPIMVGAFCAILAFTSRIYNSPRRISSLDDRQLNLLLGAHASNLANMMMNHGASNCAYSFHIGNSIVEVVVTSKPELP